MPQPSRATLLLLFSLLLAACSDKGGGAATSPDTATETTAIPGAAATGAPTATAIPGEVLTPHPGAPADATKARELEIEGDLPAAVESYVQLIATRPAQRNDATLAAARLLLELDKPADVRILLEPFVGGASGNGQASRYLLARAYAALSMWQESLQQYDAYVQSGRPALPYAYLDRARVLLELGQTASALSSVQMGLSLGVPASQRPAFILMQAQINERAGSFTEAISAYQRLLDTSESPADDALALSRLVILKRMFQEISYTEDLKQLLTEFPASQQAMSALDEAARLGEPVDAAIRGLVLYRHNEYTKAEAAFREQTSQAPDSRFSAGSYYYLGAILESRQQLDPALTSYARAASLDPDNPLADDALWWQARILEDRGSRDDAGRLYSRLLTEYPRSSFAADAAFRAGMLAYGGRQYQAAADAWGAGLAAVTATSERQRLSLWQAKALLKAGARDRARPLLEALVRDGAASYNGLRATALLQNDHDQPRATRESRLNLMPDFDWPAAERYLTSKTNMPISDSWLGDPRWTRASELWLVGRTTQANAEVYDLLAANARNPVALYTLARRLQADGRVSLAAGAGASLLVHLANTPVLELPKALLSLAYPAAYGAFVQKHAQSEGISPLLLLAFVRQESSFNPRARSGSGALGLTQVLPETGRDLAAKLGISGFEPEALLHADLNLRLGAHYMAQSLSAVDNQIFVALAAYNAGATPSNRWAAAASGDADVFLEQIEFGETRYYVQVVTENYAIYRYLYGNEDVPSLPR